MEPRRKRFKQLRLVGIHVRDDLDRGNERLDPFRDLQVQAIQHDPARFEHLRLRPGMDFEHAELAFDDLRARFGFRGFDRNIHQAEDFVARRDFHVQRSHALRGKVALGDGPYKGRVLRLHAVKIGIHT